MRFISDFKWSAFVKINSNFKSNFFMKNVCKKKHAFTHIFTAEQKMLVLVQLYMNRSWFYRWIWNGFNAFNALCLVFQCVSRVFRVDELDFSSVYLNYSGIYYFWRYSRFFFWEIRIWKNKTKLLFLPTKVEIFTKITWNVFPCIV